MNNRNAETTPNQKKVRILSLLTVLLCFVAVFVGSRMMKAQEGFTMGDFSGIDPVATLAAYEESGDAKDLIHHLKVLCYKAEVEGDQSVIEEIETYGNELLAMAKAEEIDLEVLGEEDETLLDLLSAIRSYGAR